SASALWLAAASVPLDVPQVVSPGAYTLLPYATLFRSAPLRVATSWIASPTVTGPEATVEIAGEAGLTVELSPVSLQGVLLASFYIAPANNATQVNTPAPIVATSADEKVPLPFESALLL